jgi:predicted nucleic acid-binding protein
VKLYLDANVIFSAAHKTEGRAQDLIALARAGYCKLFTSPHALEEARRNLALKSRGFEQRLTSTLVHITMVAEAPPVVVQWVQAQGLPLKDAPILAAAVNASVDYLVTGDARDFGHLYQRERRGVTTITPAKALALVLDHAGL